MPDAAARPGTGPRAVADGALPAAMPADERPVWPDSIWIGAVDVADLHRGTEHLRLETGEWYRRARFLVRRNRRLLGFVEVPVDGGLVETAALRRAVDGLAVPLRTAPTASVLPSTTVVICTRDRPELLRGALDSVLALDHPDFDVLVVDNASATTATRDLVRDRYRGRVRLVTEPVAGLARARNTGLAAATGEIVAFTDDDVVVDPQWLRGLADGFARRADVACVSGLVPSGELSTPLQAYFDDRVSWSRNVRPVEYRLSDPPRDLPLFPFSVGAFGTGANIAVRRTVALALGGFDTAFGVGTRTMGGEDLDFFVRVLLAGHALAVEPDAFVWHRHRRDLAGLTRQTRGYGVGLGAWLTKLALDPRTLGMALTRAPRAVLRLLAKRRLPAEEALLPGAPAPFVFEPGDPMRETLQRLARYELRSVAAGPAAYLVERMRSAIRR